MHYVIRDIPSGLNLVKPLWRAGPPLSLKKKEQDINGCVFTSNSPKKYTDMSKVKTAILVRSGYYWCPAYYYNPTSDTRRIADGELRRAGFDPAEFTDEHLKAWYHAFHGVPEWLGGHVDEQMWLPSVNWRVVKINDDGTEEVIDFDLCAYVSRMRNLRTIAIKHGFAIKNAYNDAEKKDKLIGPTYCLAIRDETWVSRSYHDEHAIIDDTAIKQVIKETGLKRGSYILNKHNGDIAVIVFDRDIAMELKLSYTHPNHHTNMVDLTTFKVI